MNKRSDFEWDSNKDGLNQEKHGVSFSQIKYTDEPIGKVKVISDFLPSPEELALKDETVKVTIALSKTSIDFFKKEAKK
ncbi:MAG: hypothetical protein ABR534_06440, partial [Desulfotignum sp.]